MENTFQLNQLVSIKDNLGYFKIIAFLSDKIVSLLSVDNKQLTNIIIDISLIESQEEKTKNDSSTDDNYLVS